MKGTVVCIRNKAEPFTKIGSEIAGLTSNFAGFAKDARRAVRKGRYAAQDVVDEAVYCVKRQPLQAIGFTFGVGVGIGALAGWLTARK